VRKIYETFEGIITLVEPLVHTEKQFGIASKFRRMKVVFDGQVEEIPFYSGNSIRGILRRLGARHLLRSLDINEKELSTGLNHCLFRGGQLKRGESAKYDTDFICELRGKLPLLSLLGVAIHQQLIPGKLFVGHAIPIAKETAGITGIDRSASVWDLMQMMMFTRRDDRSQRDEADREVQAEQMLYKYEVMIPGSQLSHYFILNDASEVERACFMRLLKEFRGHMRLGGNARIGFGRIKWTYPDPTEEETMPYDGLLENKKEEIKRYLLEELNPIA